MDEEEEEEIVGTHPCDFHSCFWNNKRKPASLGRCRLVTMQFTMYAEIAAFSGQKARDNARDCPRFNETDLLPPRIRRAGSRVPIEDLPLEKAGLETNSATRGLSAQYTPFTGWKPS